MLNFEVRTNEIQNHCSQQGSKREMKGMNSLANVLELQISTKLIYLQATGRYPSCSNISAERFLKL
jgi:hypothetical protein